MYARCKNTFTLGLSATPQRTDRMKLSFKRTVHSCSIPMLIEDTVLVPFHSYKVPHYDPLSIAQIYASSKERFGKSLAFFRTIRECRQFAKFLNEQGISCEVVTGSSDKERQIDDFESGKIEVIANVGVLTEGFDLPELKSVFIRDSSKLPTIQWQVADCVAHRTRLTAISFSHQIQLFRLKGLPRLKSSFAWKRSLVILLWWHQAGWRWNQILHEKASRQKE